MFYNYGNRCESQCSLLQLYVLKVYKVSLEQGIKEQDSASASSLISCSFHHIASSLISLELHQSFLSPPLHYIFLSGSVSAWISFLLPSVGPRIRCNCCCDKSSDAISLSCLWKHLPHISYTQAVKPALTQPLITLSIFSQVVPQFNGCGSTAA